MFTLLRGSYQQSDSFVAGELAFEEAADHIYLLEDSERSSSPSFRLIFKRIGGRWKSVDGGFYDFGFDVKLVRMIIGEDL